MPFRAGRRDGRGAGQRHVVISAQIEEEISQLDAEEAEMFLEEMGLDEAGLDRLIRAGYELLHLETYFTVGPKEARAWTIKTGTSAPKAAGVIHGDFEKGFIRAETIAYDDFVALAASSLRKKRARCAPRARPISSRTATCCTSCSTPEAVAAVAKARVHRPRRRPAIS